MEDFIDIEPITIVLGTDFWVHPELDDILEWALIDIPKIKELKSVRPIYLITIENNKNICEIFFVSEYLDYKFSSKTKKKSKITEFEFSELTEMLDVVLSEDVWSPGGIQFLEADMYNKFNDAFSDDKSFVISSLDVQFYKKDQKIIFDIK